MTRRRALVAALSLLAALALAAAWREARRQPQTSTAEILALREKRQRLQERLLVLTDALPGLNLHQAPAAGLLIGIPTELTRDVAQQVVTGLFGRVTLRLRNLRLSKSDDVRARVLFGERSIGQFTVDVRIAEVVGTLRPLMPQVSFTKDRLGVRLRVALVEGHGTALVKLQWDSHGVANAICGDQEVSRELHASVTPAEYEVAGGFAFAADGGAILLRPRFGEVVLSVRVRPDDEAWRFVDKVVEQQGALCRTALRKVDVKQKLLELLERGFNVKLPSRLFREIRLPLQVRQTIELPGLTLSLRIQPVAVVVAPPRIWYGANVTSERKRD